MNKNDLIDHVAEKCNLRKSSAGQAIETFLDAISGCLQQNGEVRLVGFGTFSVYRRAATQARNPRTGEPVSIPSYNQPKFRPGKALKEAVN